MPRAKAIKPTQLKQRSRRRSLQPREDVLATTSNKPGLSGVLEGFVRRFRTIGALLVLSPLIILCFSCIGLAAAPGIFLWDSAHEFTQAWPVFLRYCSLGLALAAAFFTYGVALIFIVPLMNFLLPFRIHAFRGSWYSLGAIPWVLHNALTYMVRYTFLDFVTPSPLNLLFYRMMGMKIGKGVMINTSNISDPCLITIEDHVTIGGSATICAHYGQKGFLVIAPVRIGARSNIGLKASIMGGVDVGCDVNIKPHTVLLPKTLVPDGSTV